jgi:hypothetical protein
MNPKAPVVLILGAGSNIGKAVARIFSSKGYKVALAARSLQEAESTDNQLHISSDLAKTEDVVTAFSMARKVLGIPSVVIYNGELFFHPHIILTSLSERFDNNIRQRPLRSSASGHGSRFVNQRSKCFCRRTAGNLMLCRATLVRCAHFHLYWKRIEFKYPSWVHLTGHWQIRRSTHDLGRLGRVQG